MCAFLVLFFCCASNRAQRLQRNSCIYPRGAKGTLAKHTHTHLTSGRPFGGEAFGFGWLFCILFFNFLAIFYPSVFISICHVIRFIFFCPVWKSSLVICICNLLAVCFFFLCSVFCCIFQTSSFISDKLQTSDHDPVPVICHDDVDDDADGPADDLH